MSAATSGSSSATRILEEGGRERFDVSIITSVILSTQDFDRISFG
jgi:hypothetical protein